MTVAQSWILIGAVVVALWCLWGVLNIVANLIDYWQAAKREAVSPRGERGF